MKLKELFKVGKVTNYTLLNMRGLVNGFVFRRLKSGTYISRRPKKPSTQTEGQRLARQRFRQATECAKQEMQLADGRAYYQEISAKDPRRIRNAYTAAIIDYMNRPETVVRNTEPIPEVLQPVEKKCLNKLSKCTHKNRAPVKRCPIVSARLVRWQLSSSAGRTSQEDFLSRPACDHVFGFSILLCSLTLHQDYALCTKSLLH